MRTAETKWDYLAEDALNKCLANPVTDNPESEINYLRTLGGLHVDSILRIGSELDSTAKTQPKILEIGAYFVPTSLALAASGAEVTAQDLSSVLGQSALKDRFEGAGIQTSAVDHLNQPLPYADGSFDVLVCTELLEHLPFNTVRLVREFYRVLRSDGFAFISVPNLASAKHRLQLLRGRSIRDPMERWIAAPDDHNWHWREYVDTELRELLTAGGFKSLKLDYRHFHPPSHPNPLRRGFVNLAYRLFPHLKDDLCVIAR